MGNALTIRMRKDSAVDKWFKRLRLTVCGLQCAVHRRFVTYALEEWD
jgi:hypothetical protein